MEQDNGSDQELNGNNFIDVDDKVWRWAFHEENSFNSRLQGFISIQALLITAIALVTSKVDQNVNFILFITIIGFFISVIWLLLQVKIGNTILKIERILKEDRLYNQIFYSNRENFKFYMIGSQTKALSWLLPIIFILSWMSFLVYFFNSNSF